MAVQCCAKLCMKGDSVAVQGCAMLCSPEKKDHKAVRGYAWLCKAVCGCATSGNKSSRSHNYHVTCMSCDSHVIRNWKNTKKNKQKIKIKVFHGK